MISYVDEELNVEMRLVIQVCKLGRAARSKAGLKIRQPISEVLVETSSLEEVLRLNRHRDIILDELNAKALTFLRPSGMGDGWRWPDDGPE